MNDFAKTILDAGAAVAEPIQAGSGYGQVMVIPDGYKVTDLEKYQGKPKRIRAQVNVITAESFCAYYKQFAPPDISQAFVNEQKNAFAVIFDYGIPDQPAWRDHRLTYMPPWGLAWTRWRDQQHRPMSQTAFAEFIEENADDVLTPDGATLLEMALSLDAIKKVEFISNKRLADGFREFTYNEKIEGKGKRNVIFPEEITLQLPIFHDGPTEQVRCLLRYRVNEDGLTVGYVIHRQEFRERDAFISILEGIQNELGVTFIHGAIG